MKSKFKIAALLTCHNRKKKTLHCLEALFQAALKPNYKLDVFLVDDGSTDGTGKAIEEDFPDVKLIQGDGNLYWNRGMRLAWDTARATAKYDFYLWLNDDTILSRFALIELMDCYQGAIDKDRQPSIVVGACESFAGSNEFSYGGRNESGSVEPNGELQGCKFINGNVVLVSRAIFEIIGNLSNNYTHALGDIDYGLRARQAGFECYTTKRYVGSCKNDKGFPAWCNPKTSLRERWQLMHSPNGPNIKEYNTFRRKFWGHQWIVYAIKIYLKGIFPILYSKLSKRKIL